MKTPAELFRNAFDVPRDLRSQEYKGGVLAALRFRLEGAPIVSPYQEGTAENDAFFAGTNEGHIIYRRWKGEQ